MRNNFKVILLIQLTIFNCLSANILLAENQNLRIGLIAPISGGVATWGISVKSAIELANKHSNNPAELHVFDEETCIPNRALDGFNYLYNLKKVDVLITSCLGGAQAIAPLAKKVGLPLFISGRSAKDFHKRQTNALSWLSLLDYEGEAIADLISEKKWRSGSAIIWSDYFGLQFSTGIENAVKLKKLIFDYKSYEIDPNAIPTASEVQRLLSNNPDVVFIMMPEVASAQITKQIKALNFKGSIILQSSMLQTYDFNARKPFIGALQQKFLVDRRKFKELQAEIAKHQGDQVADDFVFSYDGYSVLLQTINDCNNQQTDNLEVCLNANLRDEKWRTGASGKFMFMKDGSTQRPMVFKTVTADGFE